MSKKERLSNLGVPIELIKDFKEDEQGATFGVCKLSKLSSLSIHVGDLSLMDDSFAVKVTTEELATILRSIGPTIVQLEVDFCVVDDQIEVPFHELDRFRKFCGLTQTYLTNLDCLIVGSLIDINNPSLARFFASVSQKLSQLCIYGFRPNLRNVWKQLPYFLPQLRRLVVIGSLSNGSASDSIASLTQELPHLESLTIDGLRGGANEFNVLLENFGNARSLKDLKLFRLEVNRRACENLARLIQSLEALEILRCSKLQVAGGNSNLGPLLDSIRTHTGIHDIVFDDITDNENAPMIFDRDVENMILDRLARNRVMSRLGSNPTYSHWVNTVVSATNDIDLLFILLTSPSLCPTTYVNAVIVDKPFVSNGNAANVEFQGLHRDHVFPKHLEE